MTAQNASMGWVFDVAGLHRQGARCAQRRERLVLRVPPPSFAMAHCHENRILRQRSSAQRLNGAPEPELPTYNSVQPTATSSGSVQRGLSADRRYRGFIELGLTADKR